MICLPLSSGALACVLCMVVVASGCTTRPADLVATQKVRVELAPSSFGDPLPAKVLLDDDVMRITGAVRPTATALRPATRLHVDIAFVTNEGRPVHHLRLQATPGEGDYAGLLTYEVAYSWTPPPGTVLRITYTDDTHSYVNGGGTLGLVGPGAAGGSVQSQVSRPSFPVQSQTNRPVQPVGARPPGNSRGR